MDLATLWQSIGQSYEVGALNLSLLTVALFAVLEVLSVLLARSVARLGREGALRMGAEAHLARRLARWLWVIFVSTGLAASLHLSGLVTLARALHEAHRVANLQLISLAGTPISPAALLSFVIIVAVAWWISQLLQGLVLRSFTHRHGSPDSTVLVVNRLLHYAVLVIAVVVGLETMGINLSALLTAGAVFAVGLGLAVQNLARNFLSGIILLAERSVRPGDVLEVEGRLVKVIDTRIRSTITHTLDGEDLILPNEVLVETSIINHTLHDTQYRVRVQVGVSYDSDLDAVKEALTHAGAQVEARVQSREPVVLLDGFGASSVDFVLAVWIDDPWRMPELRSELLLSVWRTLRERGIVIAFPQMDVHLDTQVEEGLVRLAGAVER